MKNKQRLPAYQDEVKHKNGEAVGTVIAVFKTDKSNMLDVRLSDERILYSTPAENWMVTRTREQIEGDSDS